MRTLNFKSNINCLVISLCITIGFILVGNTGFAQSHNMGGGPGAQGFNMRQSQPPEMNDSNAYVRGINRQKQVKCQNQGPRNELNLTDKQKKQIDKLKLKYGKSLLPLQNKLGEKQAHLRTVSTGENVSLSKINKVIESIGSLQTSIMKLHAAMQQDIRKTLSEEQRQKMDLNPPLHHHMGPRPQHFPARKG